MKIGVSVYSERWALNLILNVNNVFNDCTSTGRAFHEMIARGKKLFNLEDFFCKGDRVGFFSKRVAWFGWREGWK